MNKLVPLALLLALLTAPLHAVAQAPQRSLDEEITLLESGRSHAPSVVERILPQIEGRPSDDPQRARVETWARAHGRNPQGRSNNSRMSDALGAWRALIGLGVLHDGMSLQEARTVLGSDGLRREQSISWTPFNRGLHVLTFVRATIAADGTLHSFQAVRG